MRPFRTGRKAWNSRSAGHPDNFGDSTARTAASAAESSLQSPKLSAAPDLTAPPGAFA
ncbi:hypothetical protein ACFPRL_19055 [Pseudoclavibacter helvolus]